VITLGGGNVLTLGGGNIVSKGGGSALGNAGPYRVLDAEVPLGTVLPAAGVAVVPVSVLTDKPIGTAVLTDGQGHYQLRVPATTAGAFRLVAAVPAASADAAIAKDPRLHYSVLSSTARQAADNTIDEDTSLVASYLETVFRLRLAGMFAQGIETDAFDPAGPMGAFAATLAADLASTIKEAHTQAMPAAKRDALAARCTGIVLQNGYDGVYASAPFKTDGQGLPVQPSDRSQLVGKPGDKLALPVLIDLMRELRERTAAAMRDRRVDFAAKSFVKDALAQADADGPLAGFRIARPSDFVQFLVLQYMSVNEAGRLRALMPVLQDPDLALDDPELSMIRLNGAASGLADVLLLKLFSDPATKTAVLQAIRDAGQSP
jgi:hypothetical protein